ncbi:flavodoxin domain-containing protein [Nocardia sp. NBC_01009]|uniref:flavodoxin domain-containing protein n=1 Tax=Nocardia sp. NBC_01009 TaxID=2975996 RepID=UPI00386E4276|nr:flavodoxin domain-containing protein [Nocardia sp. NBC_01009]
MPLTDERPYGQALRYETGKHRIAVVYATEHGSTRDIAEFIGTELAGRDATVELADIDHAPDLSRFDTVVLGSAVHDMDFLPSAVDYVHAHRRDLDDRDVWLFSVGLGPALRGPVGRRVGRIVPKKNRRTA